MFGADDGVHGYEPWVHDTGAAAWEHGDGCGTITRLPTLRSTDPALGRTQNHLSGNIYQGGVGVPVLGVPDPTPLAIGSGCRLHFDVLSFWLPTDVWAVTRPTQTSKIPIPNHPNPKGVRLAFQTVVLNTNSLHGLDLSNGAFCELGYRGFRRTRPARSGSALLRRRNGPLGPWARIR